MIHLIIYILLNLLLWNTAPILWNNITIANSSFYAELNWAGLLLMLIPIIYYNFVGIFEISDFIKRIRKK
jgi:predicted MPP superfamily phosphohydrolase